MPSLGLPSDWPWWAKSGIPWFYCWSKGGTRCFVWWNKSFMIYVWWYVQVHDVYTDATLFCNRPVLFKNILHELGPRPQEDSPQTVSPQADDGDIGTSTEADGDWRQLELNLDSLWMGRGNPPFFFLTVRIHEEWNLYIRIMLKNSKVLDVQWQYITAQLAYVQGRDLGRFVFKQAWNCVSLHLRLVDSDVECSRTALNSFTRRARTMLAPMDSESLTVPLALEGSEERSSSQHRERERERICVAKLRSRPTDGAQTDAAWCTLLAGLGSCVFPIQEPFCRFFTDFNRHCWPKMPFEVFHSALRVWRWFQTD